MSDLIRRDELLKKECCGRISGDDVRNAPAVDAVEVTYCDQCSNHGHCIAEDVFRLARVEKPFCCIGGRRENTYDAGKSD